MYTSAIWLGLIIESVITISSAFGSCLVRAPSDLDGARRERDDVRAALQKREAQAAEMQQALGAAAKVHAMVQGLQNEKEESLKLVAVLQKNQHIASQKHEAALRAARTEGEVALQQLQAQFDKVRGDLEAARAERAQAGQEQAQAAEQAEERARELQTQLESAQSEWESERARLVIEAQDAATQASLQRDA